LGTALYSNGGKKEKKKHYCQKGDVSPINREQRSESVAG
jgi:hypothetical protein